MFTRVLLMLAVVALSRAAALNGVKLAQALGAKVTAFFAAPAPTPLIYEGFVPVGYTTQDSHAELIRKTAEKYLGVIERACALADGPTLRARDLPEHVRGRGRPAPAVTRGDLTFRDARESWIRTFAPDYLTDLLKRNAGNVSQAAKAAGLDRKTLHSLLAKYGIKA